jgi:hypothetical protein
MDFAEIIVWGVDYPDGRRELHAGVQAESTWARFAENAAALGVEVNDRPLRWTNGATGVVVWYEQGVMLQEIEQLETARHDATVVFHDDADWRFRGFAAVCRTCGWLGTLRREHPFAEDDADDHMAET